jgi:membrane-associated phospholipid phosphatase
MTWQDIFKSVTLLGDNFVLLFFSAVFVVYLHKQKQKSLAKAWIQALLFCLGAVLVSKAIGYALIGRTPDALFVSISGHSTFATFYYLSVWLVIQSKTSPASISWRRSAMVVAVIGLILAVAFSRLILEQHTIGEIVAGLVLGLLGVLLFWRRRQEDATGLGFYQVALAAVIVGRIVVACQPVPLEDLVQHGADSVVGSLWQ